MKRADSILQESPTAILTADMHLREDTPICREDDFNAAQWAKVKFISELQKKYNCPVVHAGDLFHYWKPSPALISQAYLHLPNQFYTIYGNHDLPQHNMDNYKKSGVYTLAVSGKLKIISSGHWGTEPGSGNLPGLALPGVEKRILVWHGLVMPAKASRWPGCTALIAEEMLEKLKAFDLILTGDNHSAFTVEKDGRFLVNPGSLTRQTASQQDFLPRVYLWWEKERIIKPCFLPINEGVISRDHLANSEKAEERQRRMEAFLQLLEGGGDDVQVSFDQNLLKLMDEKQIPDTIRTIIAGAVQ